jgi:hypothetical protein
MSDSPTLYVSDKDVVITTKQGVSARFVAGRPRPLRESLVDAAKAAGVKEHADAPEKKTTARRQKAAETE